MTGPTHDAGKPYPSPGEWVGRVFVREDGFYLVALAVDDDPAEHAQLNPGTLRVEDLQGNVLWPEGMEQ